MVTVKLTITLSSGAKEVVQFTKNAFECGMIVAKAHEMFGEKNVCIEYL